MNGSYSPGLVVVSVLIAVFASYVALDLANSISVARGRSRLAWLAGGSLAMGTGIWSMHFVGMLAFRMPGMAIAYDVPLLFLSVAIAVGASALALFVVSRPGMGTLAHASAAFAMGGAIAGMHYTGIWSMRMEGAIQWNHALVATSIAIAVGASFVALWMAVQFRMDSSERGRRLRLAGSGVMGLAIAGMHYTAMSAAHFIPGRGTLAIRAEDVLATGGLAVAVTGMTGLILTIAVVGSVVSRELARRGALGREIERLYTEAEASAEQYRLLFDGNPHPMWVYEPETLALLAVNDTAVRDYGYARSEFLTKTLWDLHLPEDHAAVSRDAARITNAETVATGKHLRKDGSLMTVEVDARSIVYGGKPARIALIHDIAERTRAEKALKKSEQWVRMLFEHAADGIGVHDLTGRFLDVNERLCTMLGYSREEMLQLTVADLEVNFHTHEAEEAWQRMEPNVPLEFEGVLRRKDGSEVAMEVRVTRLEARGTPVLLALLRDVTDRRLAEEREREFVREHSARVAAEEAQHRVGEILESITDAFFAFDRDWRATYVNQRAEALLRKPREEVLGRSLLELHPGLVDTPAYAEFQRVKTERTPVDIEYPSQLTPRVWFHFHVSPTEAGAVVYVRDITARKRAEEALVEERRRLAEAQRVAHMGSWEWDLETDAIRWSDEMFRVRGYEPQAFTPDTDSFLPSVRAEDQPTIAALTRTTLQTPAPFGLEYRIVRADGSLRVMYGQGEVVTDTDGKPVRIIGTDQDITERKEHEDTLHRMGAALDASMDGICIVSEDGVFQYVNHAKAVIFGYDDPEELVGKSWRIAHPPEELERFDEEILPLFAFSGQWRGEVTARRKDGSTFPASASMTRIAGRDGWVAVDWDITERKRAEEELRRRSEMVQLLQVAATAANESVTLEQALHMVVEQVCEFAHLAAGHAYVADAATNELVPTGIWCTAQPERSAPFRHSTKHTRFTSGQGLPGHVLATGKPVWVENVTEDRDFIRAAAARESNLQGGLAVPVLSGSEVVAVLEFFSEVPLKPDRLLLDTLANVGTQLGRVAERTRADEGLRAAMAEAERANQAKGEFLGRMSHELRTPLNAILGFGQLLQSDVEREEDRESVELILQAGRHLLGLINEVLDLSQIEAGEVRLSVEPVSVREAVAHSLDLVRQMAREQGITVHAQAALATRHFVAADRQRLMQVLLNLLSNSIKYNRQGGSVTLFCEQAAGTGLRIVVQDTGYGIPPGKIERLFVPFERLDAENSGVEGTGLGLALSQKLMEAMGGSLGVESREGEGSRFWAELPTTAEPEGSATETAANPLLGRGVAAAEHTHTVLLVEDNLANVRLMERIFGRRPQVRLMVAMQGSVGLDLAREHRPALILLDLNLPDLSGREVLSKLRSDPALQDVPVIMVSGDAMPDQVDRLQAEGAQGYITKPFNILEVLKLVDDTLAEG